MTVRYFDNVRHAITTTGTGAITLGSVPSGWQSFDDAGAVDGDNPPYELRDGNAWETGYLTLDDGVTTATRLVTASSDGGDPLDLSGSAVLTCTVIADILGRPYEPIGPDVSLSAGAYALFVCDPSKYEGYCIEYWGVRPDGANAYLGLRISQNGGSSADTGGSDYLSWAGGTDSGYLLQESFTSSFGFLTRTQLQETTDYPASGRIFFESPETAERTSIRSLNAYEQNTGSLWCHSPGVVYRNADVAWDAVFIFCPGANITGEFRFLARRKS